MLILCTSFFDEVERICGPDYTPIEADVLRARTKTTGIYETRFTMGQFSIQYAIPPSSTFLSVDPCFQKAVYESILLLSFSMPHS